MSAATLLAALPLIQGLAQLEQGLGELGAVIQRWVDEERIVGAELLVLRGEETLFHEGYGWRHREESVPMEPGGVFCLRSMTKPVVGAAVQMLVDEGKLAKSDAVALHLPSFDHGAARQITIGQLLTHTSGLRLSSLLGRGLADFSGERAIADLAGANGPEHAPGSGFHYSDDGADTLGALVEIASGQELEQFLRARLFEPLGMHDVAGVMTPDHPLRARLCSKYAGGPGEWTRYFAPTDPPLFSFLLGSQGLYGTALDYARFLRLWKEGGVAGGERLLSGRAVRDALQPVERKTMPTGFAGLESHYGEMMSLWIDPAAPEAERLVAFGHGGSDGTAAWLFPALDLTVLYFTQSRNSKTVLEIETELQRHLVDPLRGQSRDPVQAHSPDELAAFAGEYWDEDDLDFRVVLVREGALWLEYPGRTRIELAPTSARDQFAFRLVPDARVEFERDENAAVIAFTGVREGRRERMSRLAPAADLPAIGELLARIRAAVGTAGLAELGAIRVTGSFEMPALRLEGELTTLADGLDRLRTEIDYGSASEWAVIDGARGWARTPGAAREELAGARLSDARADHPLLVAADWSELYGRIRALARTDHAGRAAFHVRAEPSEGQPHDWIVDAQSALPLAVRTFVRIPGMGEIGTVTEFDDWRPVGDARLPFRRAGRFASKLLGTFETRWESVETGVALAPDAFAPPADDDE